MKIIDLLNKIANEEDVPKKIKYLTTTYTLRRNKNYYAEDSDSNYSSGLYYQIIGGHRLNDEVEIIEEDKKIEEIDLSEWAEITYQEDWEMLTKDFNRNCNLFVNKISEIINYINKEEK